jgi:UDP-GlcNAc:undecaprenyl-phosphate/decaprenyl-phosphate GlcNAc-1-phosphate transferase
MTLWLYAFLVSCLCAAFATRIMIAIRIPDNPDAARKMHRKITPTSGGVGIIAGTLAGLGFLGLSGALPAQPILYACVGLSCLAGLLGFVDDVFVLGPKLKLLMMVMIAAVFVVAFARIETLALLPDITVPLGPIVGGIGTIFWLLVMVNTVNFMDGANGLSMGCSAIGLSFLSGLLPMVGGDQGAVLGFVVAAACVGFLAWNAFSGSIFAGDSGALFVGLICGSLGVWAVTLGVHPLCVTLCFLPMLVDVILTVLLRLARRQNVLEAHNEHAYQRMIKAGVSHLAAARFYWLRSLLCGLLALGAAHRDGFWPVAGFGLMVLVLCANQLFIRHQVTRTLADNPQRKDDTKDA